MLNVKISVKKATKLCENVKIVEKMGKSIGNIVGKFYRKLWIIC
jgi:hypothetical protein